MVLTEEERMLQESAREFCTKISPVSAFRALRDAGSNDGYDLGVWRQMSELGWMGVPWSESLGGSGFGFRGLGLISEETGRTLLASPLHSTVWTCGSILDLGASDAIKQRIMPQVSAGDCLLALALEESPHHAPGGASLCVEESGSALKMTGSKRFVADAGVADFLLIVGRSSGSSGDAEGLTLLLVPSKADGVTIKPLSMVDNRHMADIEFDGVHIGDPSQALIGEVGKGGEILDQALDRARIGLAAEMLGMCQELFDRTVEYLKDRKQFGVPIGSFQALKHRAADMLCEIELSRSTVLEALTALDDELSQSKVPMLASLAKCKTGETLKLVSREALQMHGGIGMTDEFDIGLFLKRAAVCEQQFGNSSYHARRYAELDGF